MAERENPVVATAKDLRGDRDDIVTLSTGLKAQRVAVAASLIEDSVSRLRYPPVPMFHNEDKGRDEENPNDPAYLEECARVDRERARAATEAIVMFGIELVDPIDFDGSWLKRLKWMEKRGRLDLSEFDLDDEMDLEFLFKRYIACGPHDLIELGQALGMGGADLEAVAASFPSSEA